MEKRTNGGAKDKSELRKRVAQLVVRVAGEPCAVVAREVLSGLPVSRPCGLRGVSLPCAPCEARALEADLAAWMVEQEGGENGR